MTGRRPFLLILVVVVLMLTAACVRSIEVRKFEASVPAAPPAHSRSILFAKVASRMPAGQQIGTVGSGVLCENNAAIHWTPATYSNTAGMIAHAFETEAARAGYRVLKQEGESQPEVLVAAVIKDVKFNICRGEVASYAKSSGEASLEIEWHVFETSSRRVVASVTTGGTAKTDSQADGGVRAIADAVTAATRNVLAREQFVHALAVEERAVERAAEADKIGPELVVDVVALADETLSVPDVIEGVQRGVVHLKTAKGFGSGFIVSPVGLVVTSAHVVGDAPRVMVRLASGQEIAGTVIRRNSGADVALVELEAGTYPSVPVGISTALKPGAPVFAVGAPLRQLGTVTRGIVSAVRTEEGRRLIQSDVTVHAGSSGGPLLDERGRVVGITRGIWGPFSVVGVGINVFVPIEEAWQGLAIRPHVMESTSSPSAFPQR